MIAQQTRHLVLATGALLALALLYISSPTGASQPYAPALEFLSISNSAPGANASNNTATKNTKILPWRSRGRRPQARATALNNARLRPRANRRRPVEPFGANGG